MAVPRGIAVMLKGEADSGGWTGSVLQLGRQSVYATEQELAGRWGPASGLGRFVDDKQFFHSLGFDEVHASDIGGEGGPTHAVDLNEPVSPELVGRYDAVFDGGTLGLVFDQRAALVAMHDLVRPGGRIVHIAASNNYVDANLFMASPGLFHRWYTASGYELEVCRVVEHSRRWTRGRLRSWDYQPGMFDGLGMGGFESGMLLTVVVARKTATSVPTTPYLSGGSRLAFRSDPLGVALRRSASALRPLLPSRVIRIVPRRGIGRSKRW
jgi:hypothetical protein